MALRDADRRLRLLGEVLPRGQLRRRRIRPKSDKYVAMGLISDLDMSATSDNSFAAAEKAAHLHSRAAHLVSIDSDDSFSQIVTQSTQPEVDHEDYEGYMGNYWPSSSHAEKIALGLESAVNLAHAGRRQRGGRIGTIGLPVIDAQAKVIIEKRTQGRENSI